MLDCQGRTTPLATLAGNPRGRPITAFMSPSPIDAWNYLGEDECAPSRCGRAVGALPKSEDRQSGSSI